MKTSMAAWRGMGVMLAMLLGAGAASAAPPPGFDQRVREAIQAHGVPGMAIAVVESGEVTLAKGYGVRKLGESAPVDADTIFPTGSTGKAVTATALAILVDEGKLAWDDPVIDHLPDFRMYDPWVTREMTVRDLLVHRSGLGLGAGDLLYVPRTSRSRADVVRALRHIRPATSFRSGYAYDNILYLVAGEVVAAASGQSWERFVRDRIFRRAGMHGAVSDEAERFANPNRAHPHARIDGAMRGMGTQHLLPEREGLGQVAAPAGGVSASANDLARWLQVQLAQGALPGGERLYSARAAQEMWTPRVVMPIRVMPEPIAELTPRFQAYALGWNVQDYRGVKTIQHGGAVFGVLTYVALLPEHGVGVALTINSEDAVVLRGIAQELLDHYIGVPGKDWVAAFDRWNQARIEAGMAALSKSPSRAQKRSRPPRPLARYAGAYRDAWYGPMTLAERGGVLRMDFRQTPGMAGSLSHLHDDVFRVGWDERAIEPAYVVFAFDAQGKVSRIEMRAISPLADFSYNYQDLEFLPEAAGK